MKDKAIYTDKLTKRFGRFTAVDNISFEVRQGEIFGFLGANGAGKTTAMRMLCGLSIPTSGKGFVAGFDITAQAEEVKKNIGYMSQKFSLYEDLKVWENLRLFGGIYGMTDKEIAGKTDKMLHELEGNFARISGVRGIRLAVDIEPEEDRPQVNYMPSEKLNDLMSKNDEVRNLVSDFGLDLK